MIIRNTSNTVTGSGPDFNTVSTTQSVTLDEYAPHAVFNTVLAGSNVTVTISNLSDLPLGYVIYGKIEKTGAADTLSITDVGDIVLTGTLAYYIALKLGNSSYETQLIYLLNI